MSDFDDDGQELIFVCNEVRNGDDADSNQTAVSLDEAQRRYLRNTEAALALALAKTPDARAEGWVCESPGAVAAQFAPKACTVIESAARSSRWSMSHREIVPVSKH